MFKKEEVEFIMLCSTNMHTICSSENPQALSIFDVHCLVSHIKGYRLDCHDVIITNIRLTSYGYESEILCDIA